MATVRAEALRVRIVDADAVSAVDRAQLAVRLLAGRWLAVLHEETDLGERILERLVERAELEALGGWDRALAAAMHNDAETGPEAIDVMRVTDGCRVFFLRSPDDQNVSGHVIDLAPLLEASRMPPELRRIADLSKGAIVGIPCQTILVVFFVAGGDLSQGLFSVAHNVLVNYDADDEEAVSPEVMWVHRDRFEPVRFVVDAEGLPDEIVTPPGLDAIV